MIWNSRMQYSLLVIVVFVTWNRSLECPPLWSSHAPLRRGPGPAPVEHGRDAIWGRGFGATLRRSFAWELGTVASCLLIQTLWVVLYCEINFKTSLKNLSLTHTTPLTHRFTSTQTILITAEIARSSTIRKSGWNLSVGTSSSSACCKWITGEGGTAQKGDAPPAASWARSSPLPLGQQPQCFMHFIDLILFYFYSSKRHTSQLPATGW